jgi:hypothetical protein
MKKFLFRTTLAVSLAACALALSRGPLGAVSAWAAAPVLGDAQQLYDGAHFTDAVTKLRDAISTGAVTGPDALKAKELLGRCLVKAGSRVEAKEQFKNLLRQDGGYRLDAVTVPPDEMEVFNLALKEINAEQIEAGRRIPASISLFLGKGPGDNKSLGEIEKFFGGSDKLDPKMEFGGSVRFPLRPRFSLELELSRLRATGTSDSGAASPVVQDTKYEAAAIPLVLSLYWTALPGEKFRANVFVGGGRLLAASNSLDMHYLYRGLYDFRFLQGDTKTGAYFHLGAEAEYMLHPKASLTARVLYRSATATGLISQGTGLLTALQPTIPIYKNRKVDFSGVAFNIGLRAYIGY